MVYPNVDLVAVALHVTVRDADHLHAQDLI